MFNHTQGEYFSHSNAPLGPFISQETAYFGIQLTTRIAFPLGKILLLRFPKRYWNLQYLALFEALSDPSTKMLYLAEDCRLDIFSKPFCSYLGEVFSALRSLMAVNWRRWVERSDIVEME